MEEMSEIELETQIREAERDRKLRSGDLVEYNGFDYVLLNDGKFYIDTPEDFKNAYRDTYALYSCPHFPTPESVEIPSSLNGKPVTTIDIEAFAHYDLRKDIKSITIPESVTNINFRCLQALVDPKIKVTIDPYNPTYKIVDGQLNTIIPNVTDAPRIFFGYYLRTLSELNIKVVAIDENNPTYKMVGDGILTKDGKTLSRGLGGKNNLFIIPDGVVTIAGHALCDCEGNPFGIVVPKSVKKIEDTLLYSIGNKTLSNGQIVSARKAIKIYYKGTKAEWNNIEIVAPNAGVDKATVYFYSETPSGNSWHYAADGVTPEITHTSIFSKIKQVIISKFDKI